MRPIKDIQNDINRIWPLLDVGRDTDIINQLDQIALRMSYSLVDRHFSTKLASAEWPLAADPMFICRDTEEDKMIRASAIYSMFVVTQIQPNCKILDYGCGEGHLVKLIASYGNNVVGYDIKEQNWQGNLCTTDFEKIRTGGPYDVIILYDVLDHAEGQLPPEVLIQAKSLLAPNGRIVARLHPWCSRHGTHMWKLNKEYAHLVFTEEELEQLGYKGIYTVKVTDPNGTYAEWIRAAGLRITYDNIISESATMFFENNPDIKARLMSITNYIGNIPYNLMEQVWHDFVFIV